MLAEHDLDRRENVRVIPSRVKPVHLELDNVRYSIFNISRGGVALVFPEQLDQGWVIKGELHLPQALQPLPVEMEIVDSEAGGLLRGRFRGLSAQQQAALDEYIRGRREEILRNSEEFVVPWAGRLKL